MLLIEIVRVTRLAVVSDSEVGLAGEIDDELDEVSEEDNDEVGEVREPDE